MGAETGKLIKDFILEGGKRIRAAFTYYGYSAVAGDKNGGNIFFASAAIELLHNFFLIHDDIIDKSENLI